MMPAIWMLSNNASDLKDTQAAILDVNRLSERLVQ